jgi:Tol biopolymer transport system component
MRWRFPLLVALTAAALFAIVWAQRRTLADPPPLAYVLTAQQLGVVGYRDPVGTISADGLRIAFSEGRRLFESPISGGIRRELAAASGQIRHIAARGGTSNAWIFEDPAVSPRWWTVSAGAAAEPLFDGRTEIAAAAGSRVPRLRVDALRQLTVSPDGRWFAAIAAGSSGAELWRIAADASSAEALHGPAAVTWPAWTSAGEVACILTANGHARLSVPCGRAPLVFDPDIDVIGPIAFAPTAATVFFAAPNEAGTVDLWSGELSTRKARRLTSFTRDSYAPSLAADGRVLFKVQSYRTSVAELDVASGDTQQLSSLQAETPSYHPDGRRIAVTYGTWRRVIDDAKYPDIAQEIGVIAAMPIERPAAKPLEVVADSESEDQAMAWSPNGKWIALHSHREQSDDIWLRPVDGRSQDTRVSFLGRGAEVGWPRWSPDGKWVLFDGASPSTKRSALFVIGIDQESGAITAKPREVPLADFAGEVTHGEWLPDSTTIMGIAKEAPGKHLIFTVPSLGGSPRVVHRFASEHDFPGLAVAADGSRVGFVAPATDGFFQIFALPIGGGPARQLTFDRTHKTQPAWSPDGRRLAFTVWSYDVQFWLIPR